MTISENFIIFLENKKDYLKKNNNYVAVFNYYV